MKQHQFEKQLELQELHLPNSITNYNKNTFTDCTKITKVKCSPEHIKLFETINLKELIINYGISQIKKKDFEKFNPKLNDKPEKLCYSNARNQNNTFQKGAPP